MYCALCKQNKESKYNWVIYENGIDGSVKKYRVCDDCAVYILKESSRSVLGLRDGEKLPDNLKLSSLGVIEGIRLTQDNEIEIALKVDFSQAKRLIEKKLGEEAIKEIRSQ